MFAIFTQLLGISISSSISYISPFNCEIIMQKISGLYSAKFYESHSTCTNIFWAVSWSGKGVPWDPEKLIRLEISRMDRSGVMTFDVQRRRLKRGREKSEKLSTLHVSLMRSLWLLSVVLSPLLLHLADSSTCRSLCSAL